MKDMVDESLNILTGQQDISAFGELLNESWQAKRTLSNCVSNCDVDHIYNAAIKAGAVGGKLIGAGGGGFLLLFVPPELQNKVREELSSLIYVPFKFSNSGSSIIFADQEENYTPEQISKPMNVIFRELSKAA